jgi:hypothetical protein
LRKHEFTPEFSLRRGSCVPSEQETAYFKY